MATNSDPFSNLISGGNNPLTNPQAISGTGSNPISSGNTNLLPSQNVPANLNSYVNTRNIVHFFVPQVGIVNMYINPQSINYTYKKI